MKMRRLISLFMVCATIWLTGCDDGVKDARPVNQLPPIYPDYIGVTVPCNIAPLCFGVVEPDDRPAADRVDVTFRGRKGEVHVNGSYADIPLDEWHQLLGDNCGDSIVVSVCIRQKGEWFQYHDFCIYVSPDSIDQGIAYRRVAPGYEYYGHMGFFERSLSTFDERPILENSSDPSMCINCHMTNRGNPQYQTMHVRGPHDGTLLLTPQSGRQVLTTKTDSTLSSFVYPYWHPKGHYIAYSTNRTRQFFHEHRDLRIEVADQASDVVVYHPQSGIVLHSPLLQGDEAFETFPAFSPDGCTLYFCRAEARSLPAEYEQVRYSLCSISFDATRGTFGDHIDTLVSAEQWQGNFTFPRPSYDGRFVLLTRSDYGTFPIWHREADLWMLNLATHEVAPVDALNSPDTESYHSWSTSSRWVVYGSRRDDGLYTRLYISHMAPDGTATKPFQLPQRNPVKFYAESLYSYSVADFLSVPVRSDQKSLLQLFQRKERSGVTYQQ